MNKSSQLLRGSLDTMILRQLELNSEMYGYEILQKIKELTAGEVVLTEGAIYPSLHKLETKNLIKCDIRLVGNRRRKYYSLTEVGKKETVSMMEETAQFFRNLSLILDINMAKNGI